MNELQSKLIDNIVVERILKRKITGITHSPKDSLFDWDNTFPADFSLKQFGDAEYKKTDDLECMYFNSPVYMPYEENSKVTVLLNKVDKPKGTILLVHGLLEENHQQYKMLISFLNQQGIDVLLYMLPYHYLRKPKGSAYSGEYLLSGDLPRLQSALRQAFMEIGALALKIKENSQIPFMLLSFSFGGYLALRMNSLLDLGINYFLINPFGTLSKQVWESPFMRNVKRDLMDAGYQQKTVEDTFEPYEPLGKYSKKISGEKIVIARSLYDQITIKEDIDYVIGALKPGKVINYNAGHVNILQIPKLYKDIYETLMQTMPDRG